ncbi:hypothetical protein OKW96_05500 [Sphingobacterium sp. KU25419]|nr:hypothetical protein OKW96_05500 [Sphingobacterium sp. KU25419]
MESPLDPNRKYQIQGIMTKIISIYMVLSLLCATVIQAQEKSTADAQVMVFDAVEVPLHPPKGIKNFKMQWIHYLDSLHQAGVLNSEKLYSDYVFKVIISEAGFSVTRDDVIPDFIFSSFLKKQKRWSLGIQSGRPVISLLKMKVPKEIFQGGDKGQLLLIPDLVEREDFFNPY